MRENWSAFTTRIILYGDEISWLECWSRILLHKRSLPKLRKKTHFRGSSSRIMINNLENKKPDSLALFTCPHRNLRVPFYTGPWEGASEAIVRLEILSSWCKLSRRPEKWESVPNEESGPSHNNSPSKNRPKRRTTIAKIASRKVIACLFLPLAVWNLSFSTSSKTRVQKKNRETSAHYFTCHNMLSSFCIHYLVDQIRVQWREF